VVQSGTACDFRSNWFSTLNVWNISSGSSRYCIFCKTIIPLGGNTVFFKKTGYRVDGWDADCLTEDAEIGIKLSVAGAVPYWLYDELHATQEETPTTSQSLSNKNTLESGFCRYTKGEEAITKFSQRLLVDIFYMAELSIPVPVYCCVPCHDIYGKNADTIYASVHASIHTYPPCGGSKRRVV
jgi:hypothetical protein